MTEPKKERSTQAKVNAEIEEILSLKAQGWSDGQIKAELGLTRNQYQVRKEKIRDSGVLQREALEFATESILRLRFLRMKAYEDYKDCKKNNATNAAAAAFRRMVEIDIAIPKLCFEMGWSVSDLGRFYNDSKLKSEIRDKKASADELEREYRVLVKSVA